MSSASESEEARLLGARGDHADALRVIGRATFKISGEFRDFGMATIGRRKSALILDFGDCGSVDSTILGVMAMIGLEGRERTAVVAVNARPPVRQQLEGVGLGKLLSFAEADSGSMDWVCLCQAAAGSISTEGISETMLEAHEALMNLDKRNIPAFRDVVELLKDQRSSADAES